MLWAYILCYIIFTFTWWIYLILLYVCFTGKLLNKIPRVDSHKEKTHQCTICKKLFLFNSHFKIHQRTHTGEKPDKCAVCGKFFLQASDLKRHNRTHTGEHPYKCTVCSKFFSLTANLKMSITMSFSLRFHKHLHLSPACLFFGSYTNH